MEEPFFPPKPSQYLEENQNQNDSKELEQLLSEEKHKGNDDNYKRRSNKVRNNNKLSLVPLIFLIYFHVSGGPYGQEPAVGAAGPFMAILGFAAFPVLWSFPEALVTAELSAAFPSNGGFVVWAHAAFGPFWAYLMGYWKLLGGLINLASFSGLCIGYLEAVGPTSLASSGLARFSVVFFSTIFLSAVNYSGLHVVAYAAIPLGALSLVPFLVMSVVAIPRIDPSKWMMVSAGVGRNKEWKRFFNTLFWSLNSFDGVSTLAGEIKPPVHQTLTKGLASSLGFTSLVYLIPLLASLGSISLDLDNWVDGYYLDVAEEIVGSWLKHWVRLGSVLSGCGLYQAQLGSCSYQLQGMAELGLVPRVFGCRCKWFDTPWFGIVASTLVALTISALRVEDTRTASNFLYGMGMLVELGAFVYLRVNLPEAERPFKVPIDDVRKLIAMCSVPGVFVLGVMCVAGGGVCVLAAVLTLIGVACYYMMMVLKAKMWLDFNKIVDQHPTSYYGKTVE